MSRSGVGVGVGVLLLLLLTDWAAAAAERVRYSASTCAVRGSTVALLCAFTPVMPVVRVVWCVNHLICHGSTPSVYDSASPNGDRRYLYLGDKESNCTLEVHNVQPRDNATFRFRMEARDFTGHFTGTEGVKVTVVDGDPMSVRSAAPGRVSEGANVTLDCASRCSFRGLDVRWRQDGRDLPESGPALRLTAARSANYTCALADRADTASPPFRLIVEQRRAGGRFGSTLGTSVGLAVALLLLLLAVVLFLVKRLVPALACWRLAPAPFPCVGRSGRKRRPATLQHGDAGEKEKERGENVYSSTEAGGERGGPDGQEGSQNADDVSYAAVHFKPKAVYRPAETTEDVVYSSVAGSRPLPDRK